MSAPKGNPTSPGVYTEIAGEVGVNPLKMSNADRALQAADLKWQKDLQALKAVASTPIGRYRDLVAEGIVK